MTWLFLATAGVAVTCALLAVAHRSPVVNVLALAGLVLALAVMFAILGMDFLAAIQLLVYSGAILALFLVEIMSLDVRNQAGLGERGGVHAFLGVLAAVGLGGLVVVVVATLEPAPVAVLPGAVNVGTAVAIGRALVGPDLLAFEAASILLATAVVGAVTLARRDR